MGSGTVSPDETSVEAGPRPADDRNTTGVGDPGYTAEDSTTRYDLDALLKLVTYPTDQWMLEKLRRVIERATKAHDNYEFGDAMQAVEEFFWGDFCDNYLELSKGRLYRDETALGAHQKLDADALRQSAQVALFLGLSAVLKLFAPSLPHITEECWSWYHAQWDSARGIHDTRWPPHDRKAIVDDELKAGQALVDVLALTRKWKSERNISIKKPVARLTLHLLEGGAERLPEGGLMSVMGDLLSTTNSALLSIMLGNAPDDAAVIEGVPFAVSCELAEEAEV